LSDITSRTEDFFLKTRTEVEVEIRTVGTGVFKTVEIAGNLEIAGVIIRTVEIEAANSGGLKASSSYTRHNKTVS
jgi:hypothetical protein